MGELARYALIWFLKSDAPMTYSGVAEAPDGKADVIEIKPEGAALMKLFVDQETHKLPDAHLRGCPAADALQGRRTGRTERAAADAGRDREDAQGTAAAGDLRSALLRTTRRSTACCCPT